VIRVKQNDGVADCSQDFVVKPTTTAICKSLNLLTSPILSGNTINQSQVVTFVANPKDTQDKARPPVVYSETGSGYFTLDPNSPPVPDCPAVPANSNSTVTFEATPASCHYIYHAPTDNTTASVTIKVKQDDGVAECSRIFTVPSIPQNEEICLALNLRVNGQYTLNPQIVDGQSYYLQVDPMTTLGHVITMVEWSENGAGRLVGDPSNPGNCPASINDGSVVTPSYCRYIFASAPKASPIGFSVRAVPDDNVASCKAKSSNFTPPENQTPYCLYLDLNYDPNPFQTARPTNMDATVVMSDGSKYNDYVRFTSTNGDGSFSGGTSGTSGSGTSNFRTQTDSSNNTHTVNYAGGSANSGLNIFLSDTQVRMSAACMRSLRPQPVKEEKCTQPPTIVKKDNNRYCAEEGNSKSYCWTLSGPGNDLIFTTGQKTAIGDCVVLDKSYTNFDLRVEDCNPEYRDYCFDTLQKENTPKIIKRISKNNPLRWTSQVNFSTTGEAQTQIIKYKLDYTPANFQAGNTMTAKIYDPAFTGTITGVKSTVDGSNPANGGTITFNLPNDIKINGYPSCDSLTAPSSMDKCFRINKSEGSLQIQGIDSDKLISIEYSGTLRPGLTLEDCRNGVYCNEQFKNKSKVTDVQFCHEETDSEGNKTVVCEPVSTPDIESNTVLAELVCQYFLTRASGDVFLEDNLKYGIDVSKCYPFKNVSSTVVKPIKPIDFTAPKTGTAGEVISINHEICSAGQSDFATLKLTAAQKTALTELFGSEISKLSSQICEVGLVPGSDWDKNSINKSITQNIGQLTRWMSDINPPPEIIDVEQLKNNGGIYYYKGNGTDTVTINKLPIKEGSGALTIIVENADLQINGNIEYTEGQTAATAKDISSLGVIVIDGNMYVGKDVTNLAGAYFVQRTDAQDFSVGNILSGRKNGIEKSEQRLTVNGSIYGNIGPLFENRIAAGDISKDEGAITIRYDQRIIQNPPAGLAEILGSFSQSQIAQ
jgi:hypothetical protein